MPSPIIIAVQDQEQEDPCKGKQINRKGYSRDARYGANVHGRDSIMPHEDRLDFYLSKDFTKAFLGNVESRYNSAISKQIPYPALEEITGKVYVKPVLEPEIDDFIQAPEA